VIAGFAAQSLHPSRYAHDPLTSAAKMAIPRLSHTSLDPAQPRTGPGQSKSPTTERQKRMFRRQAWRAPTGGWDALAVTTPSQAGNTVVPAILALEAKGMTVEVRENSCGPL